MANEACKVQEPTTLKELLDLFGWINQNGLTDKVCTKFEEMLKSYFSSLRDSEKAYKTYFEDIFSKIEALRTYILNADDSYGKYASIDACCGDCTANCVNILIKFLPKLHSEMWYLYFLTSTDMISYRSSDWVRKGAASSTNGFDVKMWLKSNGEGTPCIPKGFSEGDLKNSQVNHIQVAGNTGINFYDGGPLNHTQLGLFLLSENGFQDSNLASAVLFLQEFCRDISNDNGAFAGKMTDKAESCNLKDVCQNLAKSLKPLTHTIFYALYGPKLSEDDDDDDDDDDEYEDEDETEESPSPSNKVYEGKLKDDAFEKYKSWMENNLDIVINSLKQLSSECTSWTKVNLSNGSLAGPFKYGFVFRNSNWEGEISKLPGAINTLTESTDSSSLKQLLQCFKSDVKLPSKAEEKAHVPKVQVSTQKQSENGGRNTETSVKVENQVTTISSGTERLPERPKHSEVPRPAMPQGGTGHYPTVSSTGGRSYSSTALTSTSTASNIHIIQLRSMSPVEGLNMKLWMVLLLLFILKIF